MALNLGSTAINKLYLGSTAINKAYLGTGVVFSSAFDPASLFAGGTEGAWFDPSDIDTLFQVSDGTTPVTVATDPIGYFGDKSGNGNHATQAISAKRPIYTEGSGLSWLAFDGVDDAMEIQNAAFSFTGDQSVWVAAKHDTGTGANIYLMGGNDKGYLFVTRGTSRKMRFIPINNADYTISTSAIGTSPIVKGIKRILPVDSSVTNKYPLSSPPIR